MAVVVVGIVALAGVEVVGVAQMVVPQGWDLHQPVQPDGCHYQADRDTWSVGGSFEGGEGGELARTKIPPGPLARALRSPIQRSSSGSGSHDRHMATSVW